MAVSTGNPFVIDQSSMGAGLGALGKAAGGFLGQQAQQEQAAEQQALAEQKRQQTIQEGMEVFKSNDPNQMLEYSLQNPEFGKAVNEFNGIRTEQQRQQKMGFLSKALTETNPERIPALFDEHIAEIENRQGDASQMRQQKEEYLANPEEGMRELEGLYIVNDPKNSKQLIDYRQKVGLSKGGVAPAPMTEFQSESIGLRKKQQDLDLLKLEAQSETNAIQKKKLQNEVKLQERAIAKADLEAKALAAGPTAQQVLAKSTEAQKKASSFAQRMTVSANELNALAKTVDPTSRVIPLIAGGGGVVSEAANRMASPEEQQYASAASDFVTAQLRKESGAVIGEGEFKRKYREFFPVPGDSEKQIESKRKRRERAAESMQKESGGLYEALYKKEAQPSAHSQQQYSEGMTATNPNTGEVLVFRNGTWGPQ